MAINLFTDEELNLYVKNTGVRSKISNEAIIFENSLALNTDILISNIRHFVNTHQGLTKKEILNQLKDQQINITGVFAEYKTAIVKDYAQKVYKIDEAIFFGDIQNNIDPGNIKYTWQAIFVNTCKSCIALHGKSRTLAQWDATGGRPKIRNTVCDGRCKCSLIPSEVMPTQAEMQRPIKIASERVRRAEKIRGKKYSSSYVSQLTGQFNSPDNRLKDLRKIKKVKT